MTEQEPEWRERIRSAGMRVTPQREAVLDAVAQLGHATSDQVLVQVQGRGIEITLSTVYRALEGLEEVGLIRHSHVGTGPPSYHLAREYDHIHLSCTGCGRVISVPESVADGLVATVQDRTGFRADLAHAAVYGRCRACQEDQG